MTRSTLVRGPERDPLKRRAGFVVLASLAAGLAVGRSPALSRVLAGMSAAVPIGALVLAMRERRRSGASGHEAGRIPAVERIATVIVPARNEARVIADLIGDIARQDVIGEDGRELRLVVVDDRSTDDTRAVAEAAIRRGGLEPLATVVSRSGGSGAKGAALASVTIEPSPGHVVIVLDADARVEPDFVRRAVGSVAGPSAVVTARRRMMLPDHPWAARVFARLQDDEQTLDGEFQLGRWARGGGSELRGDGMIVRSEALAAAGGWPVGAVCEDLELSSILYLDHGAATRWTPEVVVWEQPVTTLPAFLRQRLRWAAGAVRRDLVVVWPRLLDRRIPLRRRLDVAAYGGQALIPFVAIGSLLGGRAGRGRMVAGSLAAAYAVAVGGLAGRSLRRTRAPDGMTLPILSRVARAIEVAGFVGLWIVLAPIAWLRIAAGVTPSDAPTRHVAGFEPPFMAAAPSRAARTVTRRPTATDRQAGGASGSRAPTNRRGAAAGGRPPLTGSSRGAARG